MSSYQREAWPSLEEALLLTEWIGGAQAYRLAALADCSDPDTTDSAGGRYLLRVAENVLERIEEEHPQWAQDNYDPSDLAHQIADNSVPIYTADIWATFADLGGYEVDISDFGPIKPDDITQSVGALALYVIAETLAARLLDTETYRVPREVALAAFLTEIKAAGPGSSGDPVTR